MDYTLHPMLILYSHGRNPPLHPPPDLKYDLRSLPNPPKALRDTSDGRSKHLRAYLLAESEFKARLQSVEEDILAAMQSKLVEHGTQAQENTKQGNKDTENYEPKKTQQEDTCDDPTLGDGPSNDVILRVGCNCALGHHRSVAFVCELASRPWPKDWEVRVMHRDLQKKRSDGTRERQKAGFRKKSRLLETQSEDGRPL